MNIVDRILTDILAESPAPVEAPPKPTTRPGAPPAPPAPSRPLPGTRPTIPVRRPGISPRPKARDDQETSDVRPYAKASDVSHFTSVSGSNTPYFGEAEGGVLSVPPPPSDEDEQTGPLPPSLPRGSQKRPRGLAAMRQKELSPVPGYKNPYGPNYQHRRTRRLGAV